MRACLILLCGLSIAGAAAAQDMKMHRKQAGEPDPSGWMLAQSTEGRFSVRLPIKFNDFTVSEKDPRSPSSRVFTVGVRSSEKIALVASRIEYRQGAASAKQYFAKFEKGQDLGAKPESVTPRKLGPLRAVDVAVKRAADVAYYRVVLLDADLLMLTVEAPREHDATAQQLAATFFDSLQVEAK
jgi:hypothetical protein